MKSMKKAKFIVLEKFPLYGIDKRLMLSCINILHKLYIICDCLCEHPPCLHNVHSVTQMTIKHLKFYLFSIALH